MSSPIHYSALQQLFDPFFPKGEHLHYWKAIYLDSLNDEAIGEIVARYRQRPSPRSMLPIWTAYQRHRGEQELATRRARECNAP